MKFYIFILPLVEISMMLIIFLEIPQKLLVGGINCLVCVILIKFYQDGYVRGDLKKKKETKKKTKQHPINLPLSFLRSVTDENVYLFLQNFLFAFPKIK